MKIRLPFLCLAVACLAAPAGAQTGNATIVGRVEDTSGAIIAGAEVEARRTATNEVFRARTTVTGDYTVVQLPIGEYELRVQNPGFSTEVRQGIVLEVGRTVRIDVELRVGQVTDSVQVVETAPLMRTESPEFGHVIDNSRIVDLPLNSRDILGALSTLAPGTAPARSTRLGSALDINVRGQRRTDNVLYLDGGMVSQGNAFVQFFVNPDAVQEFEVKTGLYGAEYGIKPGGQFTVVTKSGTNGLHGTMYWFHRNDNLDARNFFDPGPRPEFKRNQFGAVVGGPVYLPKLYNGRDRLWFFAGYSGERIRRFSSLRGVVPTAAEKSGVFPRAITDPSAGRPFANNTIPRSQFNAISTKLLQFWPDPNTAGALNFVSPNSTVNKDVDQAIVKMDLRAADNDRWSGRFLWDDSPVPGTNLIQMFAQDQPLKSWAGSITNTRTFRARVVNEFGVHMYRRPSFQGPQPSSPGFGRTLGIARFPASPTDEDGVPNVSVTGRATIGDHDNKGPSITGSWEVRDTVSFDTGAHSLKMGWHYRRHIEHYVFNRRSDFAFQAIYTGDAFADYLLGHVWQARIGSEDLRGRLNQPNHYLFIQDNWKAAKNVTLSLGLRYERRLAMRDHRGFNSNFNFDQNRFVPPLQTRQLQPWETGRFEPNIPLVEWDRKGWQPRAGVAYRLSRRFTVRGGYGLYANEPPLGMFQDMGRNPRPKAQQRTFSANRAAPNITLSDPFNESNVTPATSVATLTGLVTPLPQSRVHNFGLSVQAQLAQDTVFEIGYQGSRSENELTIVEANDATPGPGPRQARRPLPEWQTVRFVRPIGEAAYDGLELSLRKRPGPSGLSVIVAYTFSNSLDTVGGRLGVPGDPSGISRNMSIQNNRGRGESNIPHRFVFNTGYQTPFGKGRKYLQQGAAGWLLGGWSLNALLAAETGRYFTPVMPNDRLDVGSTASSRPDALRNPNLPASERTPQRWFDTRAFATPAPFVYGNAGRGIIEGPGLFNIDFSLLRSFALGEKRRMEFRFEAFNLTNHTNFDLPANGFGNANFGVIGSALEARDLQFGVKFYF